MNSPPPDDDPFADHPAAPREPGTTGPRGPAGLLDPRLRGEIENEILYQLAAREATAAPPPADRRHGLGFLLVGAAALGVSFVHPAVRLPALVTAALVLHELGHAAGMTLLGFRDRRAFQVPFAAALVPRPDAPASGWKHAAVYLCGPLPGVLAGLGLYAALAPAVETWLFDACRVLVVLNAFALLPILPLDGGRLFAVLLLAGRPWPGTVYRMTAAVALAFLAGQADNLPARVVLGAAAGAIAFATPTAHKVAASRRAVRAAFPALPADPGELSDAQTRRLFAVAQVLRPTDPDPRRLAAVMREIHRRATARTAGVAASTAIMTCYLAGVGAVVGFVALVAGGR